MKKLLSLLFTVCLGFAAMSQITADAYWEDFEGGVEDIISKGWEATGNWSLADVFNQGETNAFASVGAGETVNYELISPSWTLTPNDADGSVDFYINLKSTNGGYASVNYNLYIVIDNQAIPLTGNAGSSISSSDGWRLQRISFSTLINRGYLDLSTSPTVYFVVLLIKSNDAAAQLVFDDFMMRRRPSAYVFKMVANGGTGSMDDLVTGTNMQIVAPNNGFTPPAGKGFAFWKAESYSGEEVTLHAGDLSPVASQNYWLRAIWGDLFTVTYNANGGTGTMSQASGVQYVGHTVVANAFSRQGYTFLGWNTSADGSGTAYNVGDTLFNMDANQNLLSSAVTLYAQWQSEGSTPDDGDDKTEDIQSAVFSSLSLYPNPASDRITIGGIHADQIELMDLTGRVLSTLKGQNSIDLSNLHKGVYLLRITSAESNTTRRIVKK
ncbi:MAG: T9SS type A sorting domain-containing protein [Bacteroidales bacterium]|nr:T9SS type A sorting domain-containing protein [Bacteroidales bacterium]